MANELQSNFSYGEVSPDIQGFVNHPAYERSLSEQVNFFNGVNGGLDLRTGTYFSAVTGANATGVLIPFVFNNADAFVCEFTSGRIRFHTNDGQLQVAYTITAASWASGTATLTFNNSHCFLVGDTLLVQNVNPAGYNGSFVITAVTATTVSYALATNPNAWVSGGTGQGAYQVTGTPYTTDMPTSWAQSADVLYLASNAGTIPLYQLNKLSDTNWTLTQYAPLNGPYCSANTTATTLSVSGTTVTASAATFASTDVGRAISIIDSSATYNSSSGAWIWATITGYTSTTSVTVDAWKQQVGVTQTPATWGGTATTYWALGAWSVTTGYPTCVSFYQQRLLAGGEGQNPQMFRGSVIGMFNIWNPYDPDGTVFADHSFAYQIASGTSDAIQWITSFKNLVIGTSSSEYMVASTGPAISPLDITVTKQTTFGSKSGALIPVVFDYRVFLTNRAANMLNVWKWDWSVGGAFRGERIDSLADHILLPTITRLDIQRSPVPRFWMVRSDGEVVACTEIDDGTHKFGFGRVIFGGSFGTGSPVCESLCVIPGAKYDQVWFMVKRTLNGVTTHTVEFLSDPFIPQSSTGTIEDFANAFFVDCGIQYNGSATATFTGLSYLNGETVTVLGDGNVYTAQVAGGSITISTAVKQASIGLAYSGTAKTLDIANPQVAGRTLFASRMMARLLNTLHGAVISGPNTLTIPESATTPFSGYCRIPLSQGYNREQGQSITFTQTDPLPMSILNCQIDFNSGTS